MVECESILTAQQLSEILVLIDTWWNVNLLNLRTLPESKMRFNRYMVECESHNLQYLSKYFDVLIDTWWNVNENANLAFMEIFAF